MTDLNLMSEAQFAYQQAQSQGALSLAQPNKNGQSDFASMLADQAQDSGAMASAQRRKIKETAQEFEAQFLSQMMQPMFEGLKTEAPFGGGHAEKMWQSMLVSEYGKSIAKSGGIGLADHVERELLRAQEGL